MSQTIPTADLISVADAHRTIRSGPVTVLDCRFRITEPDFGRQSYRQSHLPGARFADLDRDLADPACRGEGRHPLPRREAFMERLSEWGVRADRPVVVYDDQGGAIAGRAWWLLRNVGHPRVALLDGGLPAWVKAGLPLTNEVPEADPSSGQWDWGCESVMTSDELARRLAEDSVLLVDARGATRFSGEEETIDRRAGHVPGARNRPFSLNLTADGRLRSPEELRDGWLALIGDRDPADVVHMCGSGVTACLNALAMSCAGLPGSALYAPSWSGWIEDPSRPIARD